MKKKIWKIKKRCIVLIAVLLIIIITVTVLFQFTPVGYCMSIGFRGFTEVEHNIFINNTYSYFITGEGGELIDKDGIPAIISEAKSRVSDFFGGELLCDPVIIISDDPKTFNKTGHRNEYSFALHRLYSFIALSHDYINVDVIAHEITHTELHYRLIGGKPLQFDYPVPVWFDEGLASINDYREKMSEETWAKKTDNGENAIDVTKLERSDFYDSRADENVFVALKIQDYYLMSRHEVKLWLDENGIDALLLLIENVRAGNDFYRIYNKTE